MGIETALPESALEHMLAHQSAGLKTVTLAEALKGMPNHGNSL